MQRAEQELSAAEKQHLISEAQSRIDRIKHDFTDKDSSISCMWQTDHKDVIRLWAEQEEIIFTLQEKPLVTIANKITKELQSLKLVDQDYTYVYDVLPAKYKSHSPNPTIDYSDEPSKSASYIPPKEPQVLNHPFIKRLRESAAILSDFADELEFTPLVANMTPEQRQELPAWYSEMDAVNGAAKDYKDKRQAVSEFDYGLFAKCLADYGVSGTSSKFYAFARIEIEKITQKQTHKLANGLVTGVPAILEPRNLIEAWRRRWYGVQCDNPKCGKWRVLEVSMLDPDTGDRKYNLKCFGCNKLMPVVSRPFPGQIKPHKEMNTDASGNTFTVEVPME